MSKVFGTGEWAVSNVNFIKGCKHDCKYCGSKAVAIRFERKTAANWKQEVIRKKMLLKKFRKIDGRRMFPSTHDIHPGNLENTILFLRKLLVVGNKMLIVSKPHLECIKVICEEFTDYKNQILFRFTIGSSNSDTLKFWEPNATDFDERLASLKLAYSKGFQTSLSCEPMLDNNIGDVIQRTLPFITDAIWIGKANKLMQRLKMNGCMDENTAKKARELMGWQSDANIMNLYDRFKHNQQIKWKESIKKVVGLEIPTEKGLDI